MCSHVVHCGQYADAILCKLHQDFVFSLLSRILRHSKSFLSSRRVDSAKGAGLARNAIMARISPGTALSSKTIATDTAHEANHIFNTTQSHTHNSAYANKSITPAAANNTARRDCCATYSANSTLSNANNERACEAVYRAALRTSSTRSPPCSCRVVITLGFLNENNDIRDTD